MKANRRDPKGQTSRYAPASGSVRAFRYVDAGTLQPEDPRVLPNMQAVTVVCLKRLQLR
jgi:hypothetical protein